MVNYLKTKSMTFQRKNFFVRKKPRNYVSIHCTYLFLKSYVSIWCPSPGLLVVHVRADLCHSPWQVVSRPDAEATAEHGFGLGEVRTEEAVWE